MASLQRCLRCRPPPLLHSEPRLPLFRVPLPLLESPSPSPSSPSSPSLFHAQPVPRRPVDATHPSRARLEHLQKSAPRYWFLNFSLIALLGQPRRGRGPITSYTLLRVRNQRSVCGGLDTRSLWDCQMDLEYLGSDRRFPQIYVTRRP